MTAELHPFLAALTGATNAHDVDALTACFASTYRNEAPCHPSRNFDGSEQVRTNWRQIFQFVPDVRATVVRWASHDNEVWSEWEMAGTRLDGTRHLMRGVIVFGLHDDQATSARFYLEAVDDVEATTVDDAVRHQVHATTVS